MEGDDVGQARQRYMVNAQLCTMPRVRWLPPSAPHPHAVGFREGTSAAMLAGHIVVVGGFSDMAPVIRNDVYVCEPRRSEELLWRAAMVSGTPPHPTYGLSLTSVVSHSEQVLVAMGGLWSGGY